MGIETRGSSEPNEPKRKSVEEGIKGAEQKNLFPESRINKEPKGEGPSSLAKAIASRQIAEKRQNDMLIAAKTGELPKKPVPADLKAKLIDATLKKREGSRQSVEDVVKAIAGTIDDETMQQITNIIPDDDQKNFMAKLSPEQMRQTLYAAAKLATDIDTDIGFDLVNGVEVAEQVAKDRGVPTEKIYEDEDLYKEFVQKRWSPETYAAGMIYTLGDSEKKMRAFLEYHVRINAIHEGRWDTVEESIEYTTNKLLADAKSRPDVIAQLDQETKRNEEVITTLTRSQIKRFWGEQALDTLPDNLRSRLTVADPEKEQAELAERYNKLGGLLYTSNNFKEALEFAEKGAQLAPTNDKYQILIGMIHFELGNRETGIKHVVQAVALKPEDPQYRDFLGNSYLHAEQFEKASDAFQMAIALSNPKKDKPQVAEYYSNLSYALTMLERYDEALEPTKKAVKLQPNNPLHQINLGRSYANLGMHEEALKAQLKAVEMEPENVRSLNALGITYTHLGKYEKAEEILNQVQELRPLEFSSKVNLGILELKREEYKKAEQILTQTIAIDPLYAEPYYHLALAKEKLGREKAAKSLLNIALDRADPKTDKKIIKDIQQKLHELSDQQEQ